jgi:hypothetical protein
VFSGIAKQEGYAKEENDDADTHQRITAGEILAEHAHRRVS